MELSERRQQERFPLNLQVRISTGSQTGEGFLQQETVTSNISAGGAFILTDQKFPMASKVELEFFLAIEDLEKLRFILSVEGLRACKEKHVWVKASGIVIRAEETGIAIIFDTDYQISPMQPSPAKAASAAP